MMLRMPSANVSLIDRPRRHDEPRRQIEIAPAAVDAPHRQAERHRDRPRAVTARIQARMNAARREVVQGVTVSAQVVSIYHPYSLALRNHSCPSARPIARSRGSAAIRRRATRGHRAYRSPPETQPPTLLSFFAAIIPRYAAGSVPISPCSRAVALLSIIH